VAAFVPLLRPPDDHTGPVRWVCVRGNQVALRSPDEVGADAAEPLFLGLLDGVAWWGAELDPLPAAGSGPAREEDLDLASAGFGPLMALHGRVPDGDWAMAGRGVQLLEWNRTHRFCGQCGTPTEPATGERARRCPACGLAAFPRLAPAVITLVTRGDEALLARGASFPRPMYSCLAGFVEPGETLEEAVRREVREEVGVELADVRYVGSQPWPFPHSLMIGFRAEWAGGEIVPDPSEIADAQWYRADDLPVVPPPVSIARALIDGWVAEQLS